MWRHEIVNMSVGDLDLAVTYCPLTGSSLAFNRDAVDGATFGVSGLLYQNNLVLFDDGEANSRWPQMVGQARCGPETGLTLDQWPVVEMQWSSWLELHPFTWVLAADQGFRTAGEPWTYEENTYPYGDYESTSEMFKPTAMPALDPRRHPKERVLGVPPTSTDSAIAFPFEALTSVPGQFAVVEFVYDGEAAVVFWDDGAQGGMAFRPRTKGGELATFVATNSGIEDVETGSRWSVDGRATSGAMKDVGAQLVPLERAYVAFWGAWAAFPRDSRLWEG